MKLPLLLVTLLLSGFCMATDTLTIMLNKQQFQPGDTIIFTASYEPWVKTKKNATLNVIMEDVHRKGFWKMRYPVLGGVAEADIVLPKEMPADMYALHFSLQDDFFSMKGKVLSPYKDKAVKLTMMLADKEFLSQSITLDEQKEFGIRRVLFADRAKVFFAPLKSSRQNNLEIALAVSLDSAYTPVDRYTTLVPVGNVKADAAKGYLFDPLLFAGADGGTLQSVEVVGKRKTAMEKFEEEKATGMFRTNDAYRFDGLEDKQFIGFVNILEFLRGRVPGLVLRQTGDGINYTAQWQGSETFFFLNEMQVDAQTIATLPVGDIAFVKVFRPPFYGAYLGGAGGAIGIYLKDGSKGGNGPRNSFLVNGYTPETFVLPVKK
jgi:hypothetical protein